MSSTAPVPRSASRTPPRPESANAYLALWQRHSASPSDIVLHTTDATGHRLDYTADDLERGSARMAHLLSGLELKPDARLLVMLPPSPEALMLVLAALRAGVAVQPLAADLPQTTLGDILARDHPEVLVCEARRFTPLSRLGFRLGVRHVFTLTPDREGTLLARATPQQETPWSAAVDGKATALWLHAEQQAPQAVPHSALDTIVGLLHRYAVWPATA